jgi:hypothetical protein
MKKTWYNKPPFERHRLTGAGDEKILAQGIAV